MGSVWVRWDDSCPTWGKERWYWEGHVVYDLLRWFTSVTSHVKFTIYCRSMRLQKPKLEIRGEYCRDIMKKLWNGILWVNCIPFQIHVWKRWLQCDYLRRRGPWRGDEELWGQLMYEVLAVETQGPELGLRTYPMAHTVLGWVGGRGERSETGRALEVAVQLGNTVSKKKPQG